jgi:mannose-1-phosphate guanylyltransferase
MTVRQAVLLVGGRATRMWPMTAETPKGLLPVAGVPFVSLQLRQLARVGVEETFLTVGEDLLESWERFASHPVEGIALRLVVEREPLDTAGGVRSALDELDDRFFVLNGDVVMETDLASLTVAQPAGCEATIALVEVEDTSAYGVVVTDARGVVEAFVEKPKPEDAPARTVNAGMYLMSQDALRRHPPGPLSFERVVFPDLASRGALSGVVVEGGRWLDIGTPDLYLETHRAVLQGGTSLHRPDAPIVVEDGASVEGDVGGSWAWVGTGAVVSAGALVAEAVVMPGARIAADAVVRGAIVGHDARIGPGTRVEGAAVIGPRAIVGGACDLDRGVHIAPDAVIGDGAVTFRPPQ